MACITKELCERTQLARTNKSRRQADELDAKCKDAIDSMRHWMSTMFDLARCRADDCEDNLTFQVGEQFLPPSGRLSVWQDAVNEHMRALGLRIEWQSDYTFTIFWSS